MPFEISELKKAGIGLVGFGIFFSFLGIILFFDRGLLALGNIFSLSGVALLLGWRSALQLFTRNYKGSIPFLVGLFLIFVRWPIAGIILEIYGSVVLFSGYGPSLKGFLYHIPVVGSILQYTFLFFDRSKKQT
ncbi:vesicle transport protein GOT1 [Canna indica]|uniref:Vesicle transport protein GOT1 n=1 Tax=Canna indica TaxID=4628 RepID=A0AAQ3K1X3_9LILI|nr:vesicle transport protein GOT1 [Canna indica]